MRPAFLVSATKLYRYKGQNPENGVVASSSGKDGFSVCWKLIAKMIEGK
jgi:hypothetical protein